MHITDLIEIIENPVVIALREQKKGRITKQLDNGMIAILQIADPEEVPEITKIIRKQKKKFFKIITSIEAGLRVGFYTFRSSMNGKKTRQGKTKGDRKNV